MTKRFTKRDKQGDAYIPFIGSGIYLVGDNIYCPAIDRLARLEDELGLKADAEAPDMEEAQDVETYNEV